MRKEFCSLFILITACLTFCGAACAVTPMSVSERIAFGANSFAFDFARRLRAEHGAGNFICSPLSVWLPLAALSNVTNSPNLPALTRAIGAEEFTPGEINAAASEMLYSLTRDKSGVTRSGGDESNTTGPLQIANSIFVNKNLTLNPMFAKTFADFFMGSAMNVDFASPEAVREINKWASEKTHGKIKNVVGNLPVDTVSAIANAIYFSDRWDWEFNEKKTEEETFHAPDGESKAMLMRREGKMPYYEDAEMQAVSLSFIGNARMFILLPKDRNGGADALLSKLDAIYFKKIAQETDSRKGKLFLPRWETASDTMDLKDTLRLLNIPLFSGNGNPLGAIVEEDIPFFISKVVQKAMIEVDEKGTTAAAVTVMAMDGAIAPRPEPEEPPFEMRCDRPFLYLLAGRANQILFVGIVEKP